MTPTTMTTTTFSAAEAAVYDRQMRLWGVEAQKRLQNSHVLVSGLTALGSELVKNLVLSGMNVTVHDTNAVSEATVATQFFFSHEDIGHNKAEASLAKVRDLNPLVRVQSETKPLEQLTEDEMKQFTVVCLISASQHDERRFNALCRSHGIAFFAARTFGFDGVMFADLGRHSYRRAAPTTSESSTSTSQPQMQQQATPTEPVVIEFPSLEGAENVQWSSLQSTRKRGPQIPRVFVKHQLLQNYRTVKKLTTIPAAAAQSDAFVAFAHEQLQAQGLPVDFFSTEDLQALVATADVDLVPVSAIVAGIVGQEIIKAISQKDEPICNYFCFDGGAGSVRRIG